MVRARLPLSKKLIPDNIQKARFNLYLVLYDGSLGVHNPQLFLNAIGHRTRLG